MRRPVCRFRHDCEIGFATDSASDDVQAAVNDPKPVHDHPNQPPTKADSTRGGQVTGPLIRPSLQQEVAGGHVDEAGVSKENLDIWGQVAIGVDLDQYV